MGTVIRSNKGSADCSLLCTLKHLKVKTPPLQGGSLYRVTFYFFLFKCCAWAQVTGLP